MTTLELLESYEGMGTSLITLTIGTNKKALESAITLLNSEYNTATKIKCRI